VPQFCSERDILYQGSSLLTANREVLRHRRVHEIASRTGRTVPQVIFRFALQVGILTGTTPGTHMAEDLSVYDFELDPADVQILDQLGTLGGDPMAQQKKRKTARMRASLKRKGRKKQARKSGHKRVRGGRKRK
jgi:diketogulonate reductase-like aldo/keto reductase